MLFDIYISKREFIQLHFGMLWYTKKENLRIIVS